MKITVLFTIAAAAFAQSHLAPFKVDAPALSSLPSLCNIVDRGAVCDGVTDDTAAINQVLADNSCSLVKIPTSCLIGKNGVGLILPRAAFIQCTGWSSTSSNILVSPNLGASTDVLRVFSNNAGQMTGLKIEDCGISPLSGTPGRFGINLDATSTSNGSGAISNFLINSNRIGPFGAAAVATTFNPGGEIADGVFNGVIRENLLWNSVYLNNAGDDISVTNNTMEGRGPGVYANITAGGNSLVITGNSMDMCDGALYVAQENDGLYFANNNVEPQHTGCSPTPHNATIDLDCVTFRCYGAVFEKNAVTDVTNGNIYRIGFAYNTLIDRGYPNLHAGQTVVLNTNVAIATKLKDQPWGVFSLAQILNDSGTGTQCEGWVFNYGPSLLGPCPSNFGAGADREAITGLIGAGVPNVTGCGLTNLAGTNTTGSFTSGITGACTLALTFSPGAVYGWYCSAQNLTTPANPIRQADSYTSTTAYLIGTINTGDLVNFHCTSF